MPLPADKSYDDALAVAVSWRRHLWRTEPDEDTRIDMLNKVCTDLYQGDIDAGKRLATEAIWCGE